MTSFLNMTFLFICIKRNLIFTRSRKNGASKFKQYGMPQVISYAKPSKLEEGSKEIEGFKFDVLHTPGHSPGSLTYVFDEFAVVGDTLFNNGIGRTDLYRGTTKH